MKYNDLSLRRHQNAARKVYFSKRSKTADFSIPLWQAGAMVGAGMGAMKGGLEQNEDGSQIDPGSRLMGVATNAAAGGILAGAAGAGIPQLMQESPAARRAAQGVYDATGYTPDMRQVPMGTADRIRQQRAIKEAQGATLRQRVAKAVDPITGRLEVLGEDINRYSTPVVDALGKGVQAVQSAMGPDPAIRQQQEMIKQAVNASIADETARLSQQAVRAHLQSPEVAGRVTQEATKNASRFVNDVLDTRNPLQKGIDAIGDAGAAVPGVIDKGKELGAKGLDIGRKLVAAPIQAGRQLTQQPIGAKLRSMLPFSYMGDTANFYAPYTVGAATGAVLGTGVGAGLGIANSVNSAGEQEQAQLDQIQAIPDPYARKKEWDVYDADLSRTGRAVGYGVQGVGNTIAGAGLGAAGGALLGGAGLTAYSNLKNKKFDAFGRPTPSRMDGLRTFLTGRA